MSPRGRTDLLSQLNGTSDPSVQTVLLKTLKTELIGHHLRKLDYVARGIIPSLTRLLATQDSLDECRLTADSLAGDNDPATHVERDLFIHATAIVTVLANGQILLIRVVLSGD